MPRCCREQVTTRGNHIRLDPTIGSGSRTGKLRQALQGLCVLGIQDLQSTRDEPRHHLPGVGGRLLHHYSAPRLPIRERHIGGSPITMALLNGRYAPSLPVPKKDITTDNSSSPRLDGNSSEGMVTVSSSPCMFRMAFSVFMIATP